MFILFILYLITRLVNLLALPIFNDEAFFIVAIQRILENPTVNLFINFTDGKEPFFFWLYSLPVKIFPDALFGIRVFTGFLGFLSFIYFLKISQKLKINPLLAGLGFIFNPFLLFYQRIGMQETLLTFLLTATVYYLFVNKKILTGIFIGLSLLTKTSAMAFLIFLLPVFIYRKNFLSLLMAGIIFLPAIFGYTQVINHNSSYFGLIPPAQMIINLKTAGKWLWEYQGPLGLLGMLLPPVILESFIAKIFFPRYFLFVIPFLILLAVKIFQKKSWLFFLFLLPNLILSRQIISDIRTAPIPYIEKWQYVEAWPAGYGIKETADYLRLNNIKSVFTEDIMITNNGLVYYYPSLKVQKFNGQKEGVFVFKKSKEIADDLGLKKIYNSFDVSVYRSYSGSQ